MKFQRGYEGHALDDIVVEGVNTAGDPATLEIQAKRTLEFTASDEAFGKVVAQIISAQGEAAKRPIAAAIARTNTKIERHYQQLLVLARTVGSGDALRQALDAPRVVSAGMRDFASAFIAQLLAAAADASDDALWWILRRFQILVFDFESPGAISTSLAITLAHQALPPTARGRARDLWSALQEKALDCDADGGDIDRPELIHWLRETKGIEIVPSRNIILARQRLADHSYAALDAIDTRVADVSLDRSGRVDELAGAREGARYLELTGASGVGKSALLKAFALEIGIEGYPLVLSPARISPGGWLSLSRDVGFDLSAQEFLSELTASGATILFIDSLDRVSDPRTQETVKDLLIAASRTPGMQVVATVGLDFDTDQRGWLPATALDLMGRATVTLAGLTEDEASTLARKNPRLMQLLANPDAKPLTRNLYQLHQLLQRESDGPLPLTEASLAQSWWSAAPSLSPVQRRERVRNLRGLAIQASAQVVRMDIEDVRSEQVEDLVRVGDLNELLSGSRAAFKHDVLRDWSVANLLREEPFRVGQLPLHELAPVGLARAVELYARMLIEDKTSAKAWGNLVGQFQAEGVHPSWLRQALMALVRSEQGIQVLDRAFRILTLDQGRLLRDLIRCTIAVDSEPAVARLEAAGLSKELIPNGMRFPRGLSWGRLMIWLLNQLDQLDVPIGQDVVHFFSMWLMASAGNGPLRPAIAQRLYDWLSRFEGRTDVAAPASNFAQLFALSGRDNDLVREIRWLFLLSCDQSANLAETYLRVQMAGNPRHDVVSDILKFSQATAKAAPAALAAFTTEVLIDAEKRAHEKYYDGWRNRLQHHSDTFLHAGPSQGPFLSLLRAGSGEGLRLVRRIVNYGLGLDAVDRSQVTGFTLDLPGRPLCVICPETYFLSRNIGAGQIITTALRALEAWGHEQVGAGRPALDVVSDILGEREVPAAIVAVAVDVLLSHVVAPDPGLIPFSTSPELLQLDWDRFNQDRAGVGYVDDLDGPVIPGVASNAGLRAQGSRATALSWVLAGFVLQNDTETLANLRDLLEQARARLARDEPGPEPPTNGPRWQIDRALRILDRSNWRELRVEQPDGEVIVAHEYVEPPEEAALLDPLRSESATNLAELALIIKIVEAVLNPEQRSDEVLSHGLDWAKAQPWTELAESEDDFERSQQWRAVVAVSTLVMLSSSRKDDKPWARAVLQRALKVDVPDRAYQVRYHALAIAGIGWSALAATGDAEACAVLLNLASRDAPTIITALGSMMDILGRADPRLPKALLRVGLTAAIQAERSWEDKELTAERIAKRKDLLTSATAGEAAWLAGAQEPPWPELPQIRQRKTRGSFRLPDPNSEDLGDDLEEDESPETSIPDMWFNEQSGGAWLTALEGARESRDCPWVADFIVAYRDFSNNAWGLGLPLHVELSDLPKHWLHPFDRLKLRTVARLEASKFESDVISPLLGLPDYSFLDSVENLVNCLDSLFWDEKRLPLDLLTETRRRIVERVMACRLWQWRRRDCDHSLPTDLVGPLQALFLHERTPFGIGRCYLPSDAGAFASVIPALVELTRDAPGLSYVAGFFLSLAEQARDWIQLDLLLSAAKWWADARPEDAGFWRDQGYGRRICNLLAGQRERIQAGGPAMVLRSRRLIERLIPIGVAEALPLEYELSTL
ncbi:hypothetical protein [Labrys miyagiensis]